MRLIERWPDWPDTILLLIGPHGQRQEPSRRRSGPTTAARLDRRRLRGHGRRGAAPRLERRPGHRGRWTGAGRDEAALFHLLNLARERRASVLMTCATPPDRWDLRTPDLLSRLRLAPIVSLEPPDDALLKAVLVKLFVDRQLVVDTTVVDYIALRIERSLARAAEIGRRSRPGGAEPRPARSRAPMAAAVLGAPDSEAG